MSLAEQIDNLLPQTQCRQCDFPSCRDYADAIAAGRANINQCPPGGQLSIDAIAALLQVASTTLNPAHGQTTPKQVARIDEAACIGCRLCIKACPVDCIIGAAKLMHTVLSQDCTGCRLCLAVCPTDCIDMHTAPRAPGPSSRWPDFTHAQVERARHKHAHKQQRVAQRVKARAGPVPKSRAALQHEIALAVARQRARG